MNSENISELLVPGLSPIFSASNPLSFYRFDQALSNDLLPESLPRCSLSSSQDCITFALSLSPQAKPSRFSLELSNSLAFLTAKLGFKRFQIWNPYILKKSRQSLSVGDFWKRKITAYLSLPLFSQCMIKSNNQQIEDEGLQSRLERLCASLGRGQFILKDNGSVDFVSPSIRMNEKVSFHTRFQALILLISTTTLGDLGMCSTERRLFKEANDFFFADMKAMISLGHISELIDAVDVLDSCVRPVWRRGCLAWQLSQESIKQRLNYQNLRNLIISSLNINIDIEKQHRNSWWTSDEEEEEEEHKELFSTYGLAARVISVGKETSLGEESSNMEEWIILTGDKTDSEVASLFLVAVVKRNVVIRSTVMLMKDVKVFLDFSGEAEVLFENHELLEYINNELVDSGVLFDSDNDRVQTARIIERLDDKILMSSLHSSPSRRLTTNIELYSYW